MSASGVPIMKYLAAQGTIDFGQAVSYVWVRNSGTDSAFMAEGATPPTPSAGDGRVEVESGGAPIELKQVSISKLSFSTTGSIVIEAIGYPTLE
jgi:hypothetical protein